ncbi:MAG: AI-2E family transporter, partial [Clostridia bacterium]|nr:AI-2E family transporter [Clostridia bacterium]
IDSLLRGYYDAIIGFITDVIQRFFFSTYKIILGLFLSAALLYHTETLIGGARRFVVSVCPASLCHFIHRVMVYSDKMFGKYIIGKIAETMIVCIIYITVLSIIKMPYAFLIAIIMTVTNLIPVLGAYIGGIPSALIVCTVDPKMLVWFLVVYLAIEQVNANIIAPRVLGSILGLRAVWIMLAVAFFGSLFGIWGMLLSAPLFSIIYALVRDAINARLARLGENTSTDHYTNMFASTAPRRRRFRRPHDTHTHSQDDNKQ